ncbi:MAG: hypothetical protein KGJ57_17640 [Sphingomonadales bacterium]|nr:hypothetical protein [Sphingomonadales bacterium]MDE2171222.1 hypothetical protein [Sphingomonadales bacterium]
MTEVTMMLLPPRKGLCQTCATEHEPHLPHNAQSLYYQTKFNMEHGRAPNWIDAMAHCTEEMRAWWTEGLAAEGVDVASGQVNPVRRKGSAHG